MKLHKILILTSALSILLFLGYSVVKSQHVTQGFTSYYTFSRILIEGGDISKAYDSTYFYQKIKEYGIENVYDSPNNLPTSSFLMVPAAFLNPGNAKILWTALSVIFIFISVIILLKSFDIPVNSTIALLFISLTFLFHPLYYNIALGQAYIFILMLTSLSIYGFKKNNPWLASIPLSLVLLLKGYGLVPLIFLAVFKKWKELFMTISVSLLLILITLPFLHIESWQLYYDKVFTSIGRDSYASFTAYQTINSLLRHTFIYDAVYNPHALLNVNGPIVNYIVLAAGIVMVAWVLFKRNNNYFLIFYTISFSLNVILAPLAEEYHYVLFLPLIFILAKLLHENYKNLKTESVFFILSVTLLAVPIGYKSFNDSPFPVFLLGYPKLYAGIILIIITKVTLVYSKISKKVPLEKGDLGGLKNPERL